jgi:hypothetical protein
MDWGSMFVEAVVGFFLGWIQILKAKDTEVIVNEVPPALKPSMPSVFDDLGLRP